MLDATHSLVAFVDPHWSLALNWELLNHLNFGDTFFFAQFQQDVMGGIRRGLTNFVQSGQLVALIIGVVLGYLFRSITSG
jgi:hypothetical protein